jgi:hypothetical protein
MLAKIEALLAQDIPKGRDRHITFFGDLEQKRSTLASTGGQGPPQCWRQEPPGIITWLPHPCPVASGGLCPVPAELSTLLQDIPHRT